MNPYYDHAGITVYHGDCRDILPKLPAVDLAIADPPYGMSFVSNYRADKHIPIHGDEALPVDLIEAVIAKATRATYIFCRWDNLREMPPPEVHNGLG